MSLFDLQDVCIAIGSIATLDLPMVVDLIGIYGLKGPYRTLTTTDWFLKALSVIPRGSWGDVARRFTMIRWAGLLVQPDEGVSDLVVDRIGDNLPQSTEKSRIIPVGARHKCQRGNPLKRPMYDNYELLFSY
ncbi:ankyrin repeat-containing protein [Dorcoceras hygrometricum]|uniref:Ankyrin repeat-containing protein n=1 Tax=Dorcoceras hygrometricum TaxID=472368 RepID=A0A2Z7BEY3_9LAMI|nr:ankyrin repeat-containing protein [Dorcoceras hygrometricum]